MPGGLQPAAVSLEVSHAQGEGGGMNDKMKQQLLSGIPVHIDNLPKKYVLKLMEQIGLMKEEAQFDVCVKHVPGCPGLTSGMPSCTCKECDMEITREMSA
jgi:hypothetical protein